MTNPAREFERVLVGRTGARPERSRERRDSRRFDTRRFVGRGRTCPERSRGSRDVSVARRDRLQPLKFLLAWAALTLALIFTALAPVAHADNADRTKTLSKKVMCMCGGCNDTAGTCNHTGGAFSGPCDTAKAMQKEVSDRVNRGDSDDLILQSFVQEYGPTVLPDPPKKGFTWLVWIAPVAAPLIALFLIWEVVRRWRRRVALAPAGGPPISPEMLDRARREADRNTDE
jgi:cytochrome c-type biogenesis protein CcmH/NrfF